VKPTFEWQRESTSQRLQMVARRPTRVPVAPTVASLTILESTCAFSSSRAMSEMPGTRHSIHEHQNHQGWDNTLKPVLTVAPGETVEFFPVDASGGQLNVDSTADDIARLDFARVNPVVGPMVIDGAEPGDAVKVTLLSFAPSGWGWTANIPGFALLADQFLEPALVDAFRSSHFAAPLASLPANLVCTV
jgi:hypothetical protein